MRIFLKWIRPRPLVFPFAMLASLVILVPVALAATAEAPPVAASAPPAGWSMAEVMALIALIVGCAGMLIDAARAVLHFTAPRTKTLWDDNAVATLDRLRADLAEIRTRLPVIPTAMHEPDTTTTITTTRHPLGPPLGPVAMFALVLLGLGAASSLSCTAAQRSDVGSNAKIAMVDCTAASAAAIGATAASMRSPKPAGCYADGNTDWQCVRDKAVNAGIAIGGCAFLELVTAEASPARVASATGEPPPERPGRAAFESYRASVAGGAMFRTATGEH